MRNSFLITQLATILTIFYGNQAYQHHKFVSLISNSWCGDSRPFGLSAQSIYHCAACNWFFVSFIVTLVSASFAIRQKGAFQSRLKIILGKYSEFSN